jgi:glutathione S-transferase
MTELDEFPQVPFLFGPDGENLYDSTAIALWLDGEGAPRDERASPLVPADDPALRFAVRLVDEALDEVGLYLVHHNRWVVSARDNGAGARLAQEMRPLIGPLAPLLRRSFPARQVRRLPYLFSVAAPGDTTFDDLPRSMRPPSRDGFPPTHALLEEGFSQLLAAVEPVLSTRPYLFGERFTLADASLYGQLGMNRTDPEARAWIGRDAPATEAWIERLARGDFRGHRPDGRLALDDLLSPLIDWIARTFVPLMHQNHDAWERHRAVGETLFNEAAFDAGRALYDGELLGRPFRSVVKTFQVRVWRDLRSEWRALSASDRARLEALSPGQPGLDRLSRTQ